MQLSRYEGELAQVMGITQRVATRLIRAIAGPAVMDTRAARAGQDADGLERSGATGGVTGVVGQLVGARHMRPLETRAPRPRHAQACLVVMQHRCPAQRALDLLFDAL